MILEYLAKIISGITNVNLRWAGGFLSQTLKMLSAGVSMQPWRLCSEKMLSSNVSMQPWKLHSEKMLCTDVLMLMFREPGAD